MHFYPKNYVPADLSNFGWNQLGFCSIYYTKNKINNQPSLCGQLINIPADQSSESTQLWIGQSDGTIYSRSGNEGNPVGAATFRKFARLDEVESVNSMGNNWIRYKSGLQLCWINSIGRNARLNFPSPFSSPPVVVGSATNENWAWVSNISNTGCDFRYGSSGNCLAIGWWK